MTDNKQLMKQRMDEHFHRPYDEIQAEVVAMDKILSDRYVKPFRPAERERVLIDCVADLRLRIAALEEQLRSNS